MIAGQFVRGGEKKRGRTIKRQTQELERRGQGGVSFLCVAPNEACILVVLQRDSNGH